VFDPIWDKAQPPSYMRRLMSGGVYWILSQRCRRAPLQEAIAAGDAVEDEAEQ